MAGSVRAGCGDRWKPGVIQANLVSLPGIIAVLLRTDAGADWESSVDPADVAPHRGSAAIAGLRTILPGGGANRRFLAVSSAEYSRTASSGHASESTASVDAAEVERAKREIQGLVQEIAELSRTEVDQAEFYDALLNKVVAALAAPGGAVWTLADTGGLQLTYQINLRDTGLIENPIGQSQHGRLLRQVLQGTDGALISPHSGSGDAAEDDPEAAANPTDFLLVLAPVYNDQGPQGVVEVFQRPGARIATQRGYLRFLLQICEFAGDYLKGRRLRHLADKQTLWEQLETFTRTAHEKLDVRETAYTIANEGRRLIGCDRVSVAIRTAANAGSRR